MTAILVLLLVFLLAALIYAILQWLKYGKKSAELQVALRTKGAQYDAAVKKWTEYVNALKAKNQRLAKWEGIADADDKTSEMLKNAQATLDGANAQAAQVTLSAQEQAAALVVAARDEADKISSEAKQEAKVTRDNSQAALESATASAAEIVEAAKKRAEEIGGSAYEAMKNASLYEKTAKAMKNIIEGYGDQYIIPTHSLLDDLAEGFGHTEAGRELRVARDRTKVMIRNGTAARCEYVEANRRETAINFVIDAFNGKVDSILSRVRHDNVGTLEHEIRDAFAVVNFNGRAFRDARITDEYLTARLEELKWAVIVQQLRVEEREEQRRIKEQIREEEKARREYERAIRDAAKQEDMLRKAMEKAQQQIEQATAEQKAKYEQQLQELAQKLKEAEERNQRALSMAQQTKRGHVYIISNVGSFGENVYKIGLTRRLEPRDRIRELGDSSVPFDFDVHAMIFSDDAPALENHLHKHFVMLQMNKVNHRKEFFKVDLAHIREEVDKLGLSAKWTMTAEATDYRETLAIQKAINESPALREAWINRQLSLELAIPTEGEELVAVTEEQ
ncbi:MAG: DUF4041 domain-containing protein [Candidatus Abyssobacteria bacterium SURF_17]|uniref:DUF4041 domain-containing protein n=1 Tax=Candidatus Abyssobacteria bacterium SURF_17 TaxID=2093361 RepID=A0A419F2P0_9BACT|nr:MAG: DUF4041 domain-containing protein [Candidatus Abyssubacteria bacterium SURF_17]